MICDSEEPTDDSFKVSSFWRRPGGLSGVFDDFAQAPSREGAVQTTSSNLNHHC
jgi:hypothetical protein